MPSKLPDSIKTDVIQQWLTGHSRDKVAFDCGISAGAVSNIVNEWKTALGSRTAEALRELGNALNRSGISHTQCAVGFRVATMMRRFGVDEDKFESFISDIHDRCSNQLGLTPDRIGFYIENLAELSYSMPISEIPNYIAQKVDEKKKIEQELEDLQTRKSKLERDTVAVMQNYAITQEKLNWYSKIKQELENYGIPVHDISKLGVIANNVSKLFGYNTTSVADALSNLQTLRSDCEWYEERIRQEKDELDSLLNQRSSLQRDVQSCNQTLAAYSNLCDMDFGLNELKLLWHTIREIADANSIPVEDAIKKFFKDIEDHYDDKLGFELKKDKLQRELDELNQKKLEWFALLHTAFPKLAAAIAKLISADGNNINIAEEFGSLVDLVLKAGGVGSFIHKLTSYPVAVAGADGYQSPVFSSKNSRNNGINVGKTRNTDIPLIQEPKADHYDNSNNDNTDGKNNQDQTARDVPTDIYLQKNIRLPLSKGDGSIPSRDFTSTLFSVYCILSLLLRLLRIKNNTIVKGRKEEQQQQQLIPKAIKSAEEQDIELHEQQVRQYVESLQPYKLEVADFKLFHNSD